MSKFLRSLASMIVVNTMGLMYRTLDEDGSVQFFKATRHIYKYRCAMEYVDGASISFPFPVPEGMPLFSQQCGDHYHHIPVWYLADPEIAFHIQNISISMHGEEMAEEVEQFVNGVNNPREEDSDGTS